MSSSTSYGGNGYGVYRADINAHITQGAIISERSTQYIGLSFFTI